MSELSRLWQTHHERELDAARRTLTDFMTDRALEVAGAVGFKWSAVPEAPDTFEALLLAYGRSADTGEPLPISNQYNGTVIYTSPDANVAFRFVHDVHHIKFGLTFTAVDELDLALWHLGELESEGFERASLPWRMLHADLVGQAQLIAVSGGFPADQRRFVGRCLLTGFEHGLLAEAREIERHRARH